MDNMILFTVVLLGKIADFLAKEPIIYLFSLVCLLFVVKALHTLTTFGNYGKGG